ncbi:protein kinase [Sorangium sp. So ce291]|uniref:protein kinase domain-containing protein n=1 Tax=Sorangium sp. So ce291 TaxID=3133294 RepID=UPI003F648B95
MAVNVFISYAPADRSHLEALEAHLAALKRQGLVSTWHRGRIGAGAARDESIAAELSAAEVVLLLVSEAFLASDSCYERELGAALERHRRGAARVVPILVRACDREGTALAELQALPRDGGAVTSWANPDEAWRDVVRGIRAAVEEAAASARPEAALARGAPTSALAATLREAEEAIRAIDKQIAAAQKRRVRLQAAGASTAEVDEEIVGLRRRRREGGQLHVGEELSDGRYLLLERIGRGGFATVWRALDAGRGDQPVAIKVLHPNLAGDEGRRERFFRGARAMAELDHPGVVRILEPKGEDGGWHYFVMELVEGEDVYSAVIGNRLPAERVVPMLLRAGEALTFAHERGLVHRDVKPANILLDAEGTPRITDFDLVWARDTTGGTRSGAMGTFLYAAPELMHRPQDADARADVYGLGMTAVFCLHGAELPPIMMRFPGRVLERLPCSDAVRKVLERAIEFEASERFPDVAAFCEALKGAAGSGGRGAPAGTRPEAEHTVGTSGPLLAIPDDLAFSGELRRATLAAIDELKTTQLDGQKTDANIFWSAFPFALQAALRVRREANPSREAWSRVVIEVLRATLYALIGPELMPPDTLFDCKSAFILLCYRKEHRPGESVGLMVKVVASSKCNLHEEAEKGLVELDGQALAAGAASKILALLDVDRSPAERPRIESHGEGGSPVMIV